VANLNMDVLSQWGPTRDLTVIGLGSSELDDYAAAAAREQGRVLRPDAEPEKGFYYRSDHFNFAKAGVPADTPVMGTESGREFTRAILGDEPRLDVAAAERDILDAGAALVAAHPEVGAIVLECTNMAPYARAVSQGLSMPVFDIHSFVSWFHAGIAPRDFGPPASAPRPWRER
jgi:hypothetical protein